MQLNNAISHNERIIFELSGVANEIQELEAKFSLLELYDIEKAIKKIKNRLQGISIISLQALSFLSPFKFSLDASPN
ncbi:hypothetical protein [Legionella fairfieldensis]|uniref:hypothetical protein n=1 Tax=Legionella fairfieldensis TaxID=45064 RepID=UPI00048D04C0|nr:hypothetical protein [Legionella fairfieldensis]